MEKRKQIINCEKQCHANLGGYCLWRIDEHLIEMYQIKKHREGMCPIVIKEIEKLGLGACDKK